MSMAVGTSHYSASNILAFKRELLKVKSVENYAEARDVGIEPSEYLEAMRRAHLDMSFEGAADRVKDFMLED